MLALSLLVGASIFASPPMDSRTHFYVFCILVELAVLMFSLTYKCHVSSLMAYICGVMIISHIGGLVLGGGLPLSPYQLIIKFLEFSQIVSLMALSPVLRRTIRNTYATTT
jgi:hypothetical protein